MFGPNLLLLHLILSKDINPIGAGLRFFDKMNCIRYIRDLNQVFQGPSPPPPFFPWESVADGGYKGGL